MLFKKAQFDVDWSHQDDVNLLKGVFDCGMGNWEAIKADSTYDLQDKVRNVGGLGCWVFCGGGGGGGGLVVCGGGLVLYGGGLVVCGGGLMPYCGDVIFWLICCFDVVW